MRKYFIEFIGTFFLVLTVGCTLLLGGGTPFAPIAIGFALMIMVYAGGYISGGHYNPAVSLAAYVRGALDAKHVLPYMFFQVFGAAIAAMIVMQFAQTLRPAPIDAFNIPSLLIAEFLFTFALCYVVLNTATSMETDGNSYYGFAIGATVTTGAFAVGGICAAAFNPAVATGAAMLHLISWKIAFLTIAANFIGGLVAAVVYRLTALSDE